MGLGGQAIDAIAREHKYKPITGDVLFVGRQTTYVTPDELAQKLREHGNAVDPGAIEIDRTTVGRRAGYGEKELVTDRSILCALGVSSVKAIDISAYEGAEIVHDLNLPVPPHLEGAADFLVDGSTLDNVFDPAMALRNYTKLLKPKGRLLLVNAYNTLESAYTLCSPPWFFDYFAENGFADCKVYLMMGRRRRLNAFWLDPDYTRRNPPDPVPFASAASAFTVVFAEKGANSTAHRTPIQQHYRAGAQSDRLIETLNRIGRSDRPHLVRSSGDLMFNRAFAGYVWINRDFAPRRHWRQIPHRAYWKIRREYKRLVGT